MTLTLNLILAIILGGGWLFSRLFQKMKLPAVLGMLVFGILCSVFIKEYTHNILWELDPYLKSFALIVILLRGGLGIQKKTLQKVGRTAILMSFIPCLIEASALTILIRYFFHFDWYVSGLTAFMLSAVSPAVIVPSMLDLKKKGTSNVPTLIMAGALTENVVAITLFSVFLGLIQTPDVNIIKAVLSIPVSIVIGILSGIILGYILLFFSGNGIQRFVQRRRH